MADIRIDLGFDDLSKAQQVAKELQKAAKNISAAMKKTGKVVEADLKKSRELAKASKLVAVEKKKLNTVDREQIKLAKQLATVNAKLALATSKEARLLSKKQAQLRKINAELRTGGKNTASWGKALGSFQFKFNALGNIAASVASKITQTINRAMRDALKTIKDFDQAMADVQSITKATAKDFDRLRESAKKLGGSTKFTAVEVAGLQKEYSKLGFTTNEILNAQEATLALAAATNTELPRAAEVVGVTIRQFRLNASEAGRVTDVMAESFTSSGLDMEKFAESMKFVGPAAKASGLSIEETTALLGQLADAGITGSMAGTSLRQIMLALSKGTGTFAEKLAKATEGELGLADAAEEVQRRAATSLLVLKAGAGTIDEFTKSLEDAGGAAQEMADVQLNTLSGQITLLESAWDGLIVTIGDTPGAVEGAKESMGTIAKAIQLVTGAIEKNQERDGAWRKGQKESRKFFLQSVPIIGGIFRTRQSLSFITNALHLRQEELTESTDELTEAFKRGEHGKHLEGMFAGLIGGDAVTESINTLKEELKKLQEKRDEASKSEVGALNREIALLEKKIDLYRTLGTIILPAVKEITNSVVDELADLDDPDFVKGIDFDPSTSEELKRSTKERRALQKRARKELKAEREKDEQDEKDKEERKKAILSDSFGHASGLVSSLAAATEAAKQKELSAVGDNAIKRAEIETKFAKKEQAFAVSSALINGAEAITQIWSKWAANPIIAGIFTGIAAGQTAAQIAIIKNQKFAEGEVDVKGPAHSRGGIAAEIEGGESVINKRSTGKYKGLLEAINQDDQVRIAAAMSRDKKITVNNAADPYSRKLYELMRSKETYGEDGKFYYKHKNGVLYKARK